MSPDACHYYELVFITISYMGQPQSQTLSRLSSYHQTPAKIVHFSQKLKLYKSTSSKQPQNICHHTIALPHLNEQSLHFIANYFKNRTEVQQKHCLSLYDFDI